MAKTKAELDREKVDDLLRAALAEHDPETRKKLIAKATYWHGVTTAKPERRMESWSDRGGPSRSAGPEHPTG